MALSKLISALSVRLTNWIIFLFKGDDDLLWTHGGIIDNTEKKAKIWEFWIKWLLPLFYLNGDKALF